MDAEADTGEGQPAVGIPPMEPEEGPPPQTMASVPNGSTGMELVDINIPDDGERAEMEVDGGGVEVAREDDGFELLRGDEILMTEEDGSSISTVSSLTHSSSGEVGSTSGGGGVNFLSNGGSTAIGFDDDPGTKQRTRSRAKDRGKIMLEQGGGPVKKRR